MGSVDKMNGHKYKMLVFDMDGVILDSEPLHEYAKKRILQDYNISPNIDLSWSVGNPNIVLWRRIITQYKISSTPEELEQKQYEYIIEQLEEQNVKANDGLEKLLDWAERNDFLIGLASSSNRYFVDYVLRFLKIKDYFEYTVAGDEVTHKKPKPDVYLAVISMTDILPSQVIAIEDSSSGIRAALEAGISCIGYQNPTSGKQDLSLALHVITSLDEVQKLI